jgi:hypothetical protein
VPRNIIGLIGASGGQGTSTIATVLAIAAAAHRRTGLISPHPADLAVGLGLADDCDRQPIRVSPNLTIADLPLSGPALNIIDCGSLAHPAPVESTDLIVVVRGPCFGALTKLTKLRTAPVKGIILVRESYRSVTPADAVEASGLRLLAEIPASDRVARAADAGLLAQRCLSMVEFAPLIALAQHMCVGSAE